MLKAKTDLFSSNTTLVVDAKGDKCKLLPDISDEEMFAIGRVTVSWAYLEHAILDDCAAHGRRSPCRYP